MGPYGQDVEFVIVVYLIAVIALGIGYLLERSGWLD